MNTGDKLALEALANGEDPKLYNIAQIARIALAEIDRLKEEVVNLQSELWYERNYGDLPEEYKRYD